MCLILLSGQDGCGALEHPAEPVSEQSASIWRTEIVGLLLRLPGFQLLSLSQGLLGAKSAKPTSLLTLNLPSMPRHIVQHRLCRDVPVAASIGKDGTGRWRTAVWTEYPPSFCHALAECISAAAAEPELAADLIVDPQFWDTCEDMIVGIDDQSEQFVVPDFAL